MTEVKQIEIAVESTEKNALNVIVDYFVSDVEDEPRVVDIFCRFQSPRDEKDYEIRQREPRDVIDSNPGYVEQCVKDTIHQFLGKSKA